MALSRSMLESTLAEFNVTSEAIEKIISGHTESINGLKAERDLYKTERDQYKTERDQYKTEADKAESYKTASEGWETKYNAEHGAFETYKTEQAQAKELGAKKEAYTALLKEAGVYEKTINSILNVTDFSGIELENGAIKGADTHKENIKNAWSDFITETKKEGAGTDNPPGGDPGNHKPAVPFMI